MAYGDNYKVYGPYIASNGRQIVITVDESGNRRTVSYPKWIMELKLQRRLDVNETVDHLNYDYFDNNLSNLRVVDRAEHSADDTRRVKLVKFKCAWCKQEKERTPRAIRDAARKNNAGPFCDKSCAAKYSRRLKLKLIEKLPTQQHIESEYYRRKNIKSSDEFLDFLIKKYAIL